MYERTAVIRSNRRKAFCLLLCLALLSCSWGPALAADALTSAPLTSGATQNGMVRVRLSSLGSPAKLNLTLQSAYTASGQSTRSLSAGANVTVQFDSATGQLTLTAGGSSTAMGTSFRLSRSSADSGNGLKIAQGRSPSNLYPADFYLTARSSSGSFSLYVIAYVYMEDYLYGVLPYEMGNSSGMEALKAQAVAARTYTMRAMAASSSSLYDVVDTTGDQVYSGTPSGSANCKAAVDATKGIALKNGSSFTATYYTASNGGQTESIKNAWGTNGYPYLMVKDDPYDLANPDSRKVSFSVSASGSQSNAKLGALLSQKAIAAFGSGAVVTAVTAVTPHTPKYASPSRLYTKLDFTVRYSRNGIASSGTLTFDIFSELESALGMNVTSGSNELWSVTPTSSGFTVYARRYGHGIGMSQRGAMYMAQLGYTYDQILAFYYEGCSRVQFSLTRSVLSAISNGKPSYDQTTAESPAPLESPAAPSVAPSARVTTKSGSLNLRESASSSARVLRTIPQNEIIPILEQGSAWCKTTYAGLTGYVMTSFLTFLSNEPTPAPSPTAAPSPSSAPQTQYARVTTVRGSLNLRAEASGNARVLRTIPQNEIIPVLFSGDGWCKTTYAGLTGYVMTSFLTFLPSPSTPAPTPAPEPTASPAPTQPAVSAWVQTPHGSLNLRQNPYDTARVLRTIPKGDLVLVLKKGDTWCEVLYNGQSGYVMTAFLSFQSIPQPTAAPTLSPAPTLPPAPTAAPGVSGYAQVTTASGSLNLRQEPRDNARVITRIPQFEMILVNSRGAVWSHVTYNGVSGYVMTRFLTFTDSPLSPALPAATAAPLPTLAPSGGNSGLKTLQTAVVGRVMPRSATKLNLRAACSLDASVVTQMTKYDYVIITAVGDTWCAVEYEGKAGFCLREHLEFPYD